MIVWVKTGRTVTSEGTTITYSGIDTNLTIESRKRHIKHANRAGTWDNTTYFVLKNGVEIKERWSLKEAKDYAESYYEVNKE